MQAGGKGTSRVVKAILQAAKNGELKGAGVLGRLGDLCSTSAEFDVAVSNAGGMWDAVPVEHAAGSSHFTTGQPGSLELVSEELFVAFSKKSPCVALSSQFGKGITDLTEDGRFRELVRNALRKWDTDESAEE